MAGSSGTIDVVAHSRGGLVVRWWLEAFGSSLPGERAGARRAGGLAAHGTSLAAPDKIQHAMSLISNIGTFAEKTMSLVGVANPFLWVAGKLIEVIVSVTGALAKTPLVDALAALVPGLAGQSAVDNNHEMNRCGSVPARRSGVLRHPVELRDREPDLAVLAQLPQGSGRRPGRRHRFPGDNDLVVDTWSMTDFGVRATETGRDLRLRHVRHGVALQLLPAGEVDRLHCRPTGSGAGLTPRGD